jgi:hypothetical protein
MDLSRVGSDTAKVWVENEMHTGLRD